MTERPTLYLIDGHAMAYRQFYAFNATRGASFSTRDGEPTGAVYGFTRVLLDILEKEKPHYLAVTFDRGLSGREDLYHDYKQNRSAMPEELVQQMPRLYELVRAFNIPLLELDGYEADDVIGTITRHAEAQDVIVHVITGDRDMLQLLSPHVFIQLANTKGDDILYDAEKFAKKYGLQSHQLVDLKALMGDSSDNIPGVAGIGEKTATQLLQQHGTLEAIYENIASIKGAVQQKLINGRGMAFLSQKLATIQRDLPIELNLEACITHDFDAEEVDRLFEVLQFRSLRQRLFGISKATTIEDTTPAQIDNTIKTVLVDTPQALAQLVARLNAAETIAWDTETTGIDPMRASLVGISMAVDEETGYYIPVGHLAEGRGTLFEMPASQQLHLEKVIEALHAPLTNPQIGKVAHNATYDLTIMQRHGIDVQPIVFDTMLGEWVRDPVSRFLGLKNFALQELGIRMQEISDLIGTGKNQRTMAEIPVQDVAPYAAADAVVTLRAMNYLKDKLKQKGLLELLTTLEMPLIPIIAKMESWGALIDVSYLQQMSEQFSKQISTLEAKIFALCGQEFNIGSPKQLNEVLFNHLKLSTTGLKRKQHGFSTDIVTLEALRNAHPVIPLLIEYRELTKLKNTYIDALPTLINPATGRVHTSYNQTGTSTGRFSSSNPNLQNIPIRTELGREVRRAFIAPKGYWLLAVDYSQIELRVMAHISKDKTLQQAFKDGLDIHKATAATVYGVPLSEVTSDQRGFAKRVNFGLMYGMGAFRLSRDSDLTLAEANAFINRYFQQMPNVERYIEETKKQALSQGYVETLLGRKRYFPRLQRNATSQESQAELRAAINAPIQGTAADILKLAMITLYRELSRFPDVKMTLQVHDELVFEVPQEQLEEVATWVIAIMQDAYRLDVPLIANAEYGQNWLDMQPFN